MYLDDYKRWSEAKVENKGVGWCGYVEPGTWVTEGVINTAGTCLRWVRDTLFPGEDYDIINREAAEALSRGSSLMFYPYMNGPSSPDYYAEAEGTFYGVNLATKRGDFALAVMEGIAFQIRIILEAMDASGKVDTLILFGGGAKYSNGEDSLFLKEFMDKGYRVYTAPVTIGREQRKGESSWFAGYNEKFFYDRGVLYRALYGVLAKPMAIRFLLAHRGKLCKECPLSQAYRRMKEGIRDGK